MRFFLERPHLDLGDLSLQKPVGSGGAGDVYRLEQPAGLCVKLYKGDYARAHEGKVRAMLANPPALVRAQDRDHTVQMAWPEEAVVDEAGAFRGFAMPFIDFAASWGLNQALNPRLRRAKGIPDDLVLRLTAACNLAILMDSLHQAGHHVIDVKPQNIRVYAKPARRAGFIALIDCDGFAISGGPGNASFPATLATPEYAHPKGISVDGHAVNLDWMSAHPREQDLWALAVLVFLLLNECHPLQGVPTAAFADYPSELPLLTRRHRDVYAYGLTPNPRVEPVPQSLHTWFDPEVRRLFDRAFGGELTPPAAREWKTALVRLTSPAHVCRANRHHWKLGGVCGLCERERRVAADMTQVAVPGASRVGFSWLSLWARLPTANGGLWLAWGAAVAACGVFGGLAGSGLVLAGGAPPLAEEPVVVAGALGLGLALAFGPLLRGLLRWAGGPPPPRRGFRWLALAAGALLLPGGLQLGAVVAQWTLIGLPFSGSVVLGEIERYGERLARAGDGAVALVDELRRPLAGHEPAEPSPTPAQVSEIQRELARQGLYGGGIDGVLGGQTRNAIAAFARPRGLAPTAPATADAAKRLIERLRQANVR